MPNGNGPEGDSARRRLFSPSLLTPAESTISTFAFEGTAELSASGGRPPPPPPVASPTPPPQASSSADGSAATGGGAFGCSPLFGVPLLVKSPTLKSPIEEVASSGSAHRHRASVVSSLCPSSGGGTAPLETPGCGSSTSQSTAGLRTRHRGSLGGIGEMPSSSFSPASPPEVAPVPNPELRSYGSAPALFRRPSDTSELVASAATAPALGPSLSRSSSRSSFRHVTPPPSVGRCEAPPPGCVAEKVSIFEQRCHTPATPPQGPATPIPDALRHGPRSEPVPTPIGRQQRRSHEGIPSSSSVATVDMLAFAGAFAPTRASPTDGDGRNSFSSASLASTFAVPPAAHAHQAEDIAATSTRELLEGPLPAHGNDVLETQLEESPPLQKECRRKLSWPGPVDADSSLMEF